jgi:oligoribonuclease (3'-5' exoribonuclease)
VPKEGSKLVKGDAVTVTFKIGAEDKTVELNTIITDNDLGEIATADEAGIKALN